MCRQSTQMPHLYLVSRHSRLRRVGDRHGPRGVRGAGRACRRAESSREPRRAPPPVASDRARRSSRGDVASTTRASASDGSARRDATTSVALKEWAAVVAALAPGEQTVLFRKGGLRDGGGKTKGFTLESGRFALFPTNYHPPSASAADVLARPEASPARRTCGAASACLCASRARSRVPGPRATRAF